MDISILSRLSTALNVVVLNYDERGRFKTLADTPQWFRGFVANADHIGNVIEINSTFPFLDNFLIDAQAHWTAAKSGHISSGMWIEVDTEGKELPLEAFAVYEGGTCILLIQLVEMCFREELEVLQAARETVLGKELLEKEVQRRTREIRLREEEVAMRLLAAAGFRDQETGAHVRRIGLYAETMTRELGWEPEHINDIRVAAPMHDIGKIGIPDRILLKPGKLDHQEFEIMKRHAEIGAEMLGCSEISMLILAREIALGHHEQWQGQGYPHGLCGEEIPKSARIVAILDTYDALVHKRVYKPAFPEQDAVAYLQNHSGKQFDPTMVELFLDLLPEIREIRETITDEEFTLGPNGLEFSTPPSSRLNL